MKFKCFFLLALVGCGERPLQSHPDSTTMEGALGGGYIYVEDVTDSRECQAAHSDLISWVRVEKIRGYSESGIEDPVLIFGGSGESVGLLDVLGMPAPPFTLKSSNASSENFGECSTDSIDETIISYGGWVLTFELNDDFACAATISELESTVLGDEELDDICSPDERRLPLSEWRERIE